MNKSTDKTQKKRNCCWTWAITMGALIALLAAAFVILCIYYFQHTCNTVSIISVCFIGTFGLAAVICLTILVASYMQHRQKVFDDTLSEEFREFIIQKAKIAEENSEK